jgi:AcrR family transcriptional regulator
MVKPSGQRTPPRDSDTERQILDAAHTVFVRHGTAGARMQEIADEAGVNKALLHYYFRSKSRLASAVFQRVAAALFARLGEVLGGEGDLEDKLPRVIALYLDQLSKTPYAPGYILSELNQHPGRAREFAEAIHVLRARAGVPDLLASVDRQIKARVRAGAMRPIATEQFIANLASLCVFPFAARPMLGAVLGWDDGGFERFIKQRRSALPRFFLDALRP